MNVRVDISDDRRRRAARCNRVVEVCECGDSAAVELRGREFTDERGGELARGCCLPENELRLDDPEAAKASLFNEATREKDLTCGPKRRDRFRELVEAQHRGASSIDRAHCFQLMTKTAATTGGFIEMFDCLRRRTEMDVA